MKLEFDQETIREVVAPVAAEIALAIREAGQPDESIALPEAEAATRLGMAAHQLRDRRIAGEIVGSKLGGRWFYEVAELRDYVRRNRSD